MLEKMAAMERRYEELTSLMAQPEVIADYERWHSLNREYSLLEEGVSKYREFKRVCQELEDTRDMLNNRADTELSDLIQQEIQELDSKSSKLKEELRLCLLPREVNPGSNSVIMEIRAGTGGEEASLFAADLFQMYTRYAQSKRWHVEVIDISESSRGGFKEIVFEVKGKEVFNRLKFERGVHRVQRVPVTEAGGRIHTSTATVAVLPEVEEKEVKINPNDLKIDIFHSGGAGGQNVNKVATAVRITHLPTGVVAVCQDERSQLQNRLKAMRVLLARLVDIEQRKQQDEVTQERREQVGTGERAEKIRTYNFPQNRVTDHRVGLAFHNLSAIMEGEIDDLLDALASWEQSKRLEEICR